MWSAPFHCDGRACLLKINLCLTKVSISSVMSVIYNGGAVNTEAEAATLT